MEEEGDFYEELFGGGGGGRKKMEMVSTMYTCIY